MQQMSMVPTVSAFTELVKWNFSRLGFGKQVCYLDSTTDQGCGFRQATVSLKYPFLINKAEIIILVTTHKATANIQWENACEIEKN